MDLNGDIQLSRQISDGLLFFPARMVTDADFGDAVTFDEVRYDQFGRSLQNQKILTERLKFLFELYQRLTQETVSLRTDTCEVAPWFWLGHEEQA